MSDGPALSLKMDTVRRIFEASRQHAMVQEDLDAVYAHLEQVRPEFRTVACEGVSMGLALNDLSRNKGKTLWALFEKRSDAAYIPDVYTGLGCALAHEDRPFEQALSSAAPSLHYRIVDGYGFYKGLFRHRRAVQHQHLPEGLDELLLRYYDQGLGRSLWYTAAGDPAKITGCIQKFPAERHAELWRGIGIAATYLGGSDEQRLSALLLSSAQYQLQLKSGAAISARARMQSGMGNTDVDLACRLWCSMDAAGTAELAEKLLNGTSAGAREAYHAWMSALDKQFASSPRYQFSS